MSLEPLLELEDCEPVCRRHHPGTQHLCAGRQCFFYFFSLIVFFTVRKKNETRVETRRLSWRTELLGLLVFVKWKLIHEPFFFSAAAAELKDLSGLKLDSCFWSASKWMNKVATVLNKSYIGSSDLWRVFRDPHPGLFFCKRKGEEQKFEPTFSCLSY